MAGGRTCHGSPCESVSHSVSTSWPTAWSRRTKYAGGRIPARTMARAKRSASSSPTVSCEADHPALPQGGLVPRPESPTHHALAREDGYKTSEAPAAEEVGRPRHVELVHRRDENPAVEDPGMIEVTGAHRLQVQDSGWQADGAAPNAVRRCSVGTDHILSRAAANAEK